MGQEQRKASREWESYPKVGELLAFSGLKAMLKSLEMNLQTSWQKGAATEAVLLPKDTRIVTIREADLIAKWY